jgi:branched-chain amino acid transport system substrate-binding protein
MMWLRVQQGHCRSLQEDAGREGIGGLLRNLHDRRQRFLIPTDENAADWSDSLFLPNYYAEVPLQVQQAHKLGFNGPVLGSDSWGASELLTLCGADCEGLFFTTHYAADIATEKAQNFIKAYQTAYSNKTPDDVAALTYDAFGMLFQSLQTAGKIDREAVRDAIASISLYEGVTGNMQFKGTGDPIKSAVVIQIKDGKFTYYQTANP